MLIANAQSDEGKMLVIGIDEPSMDRLNNDQPFSKDLSELIPALSGWKLVILGPEDTARFAAQTG